MASEHYVAIQQTHLEKIVIDCSAFLVTHEQDIKTTYSFMSDCSGEGKYLLVNLDCIKGELSSINKVSLFIALN